MSVDEYTRFLVLSELTNRYTPPGVEYIRTNFPEYLSGTQRCSKCVQYFCFCDYSLAVHAIQDELNSLRMEDSLYCMENMPPTSSEISVNMEIDTDEFSQYNLPTPTTADMEWMREAEILDAISWEDIFPTEERIENAMPTPPTGEEIQNVLSISPVQVLENMEIEE